MGKSLLRALDTCGRSPALNPTMLAFASLAEVRTFRPCSVDTAVAPAAAVAALELDQVTVFPPAAAAAALDLDQEQVCRVVHEELCDTFGPGAVGSRQNCARIAGEIWRSWEKTHAIGRQPIKLGDSRVSSGPRPASGTPSYLTFHRPLRVAEQPA